MIRRLGLFLIALVLATGVALPVGVLHAQRVAAVGSACFFSDFPDVPYQNWYTNDPYGGTGDDTYAFTVISSGWTIFMHADIESYRYSHNGACYRGAYESFWTVPAASGNFHMILRTFRNAQLILQNDKPAPGFWNWGTGAWNTTNCFGTTLDCITVAAPDHGGVLVDVINMFGNPDNFDNYFSQGSNYDWIPNYITAQCSPGNIWPWRWLGTNRC